jgi:hypothetical protein
LQVAPKTRSLCSSQVSPQYQLSYLTILPLKVFTTPRSLKVGCWQASRTPAFVARRSTLPVGLHIRFSLSVDVYTRVYHSPTSLSNPKSSTRAAFADSKYLIARHTYPTSPNHYYPTSPISSPLRLSSLIQRVLRYLIYLLLL